MQEKQRQLLESLYPKETLQPPKYVPRQISVVERESIQRRWDESEDKKREQREAIHKLYESLPDKDLDPTKIPF